MITLSKSIKDVFATFSNQFWRLITGPLVYLLIPIFLSEVQQGYWFLFISLAALSIFADLGFSNIILQFSSHEFAYLEFDSNGLLCGSEQHIQRIGSFFRFVVKWLSTISAIVYPIIFIAGVFFFLRDKVFSIYIIPWCLYSAGTLINFFNNSVLSFIEGMDHITKVQKSRLIVGMISTLTVIVCLILKLHIFALSLSMIISSSYMFLTIFHTFGKVIKQIWTESSNFRYPWRNEILPLFKRYVVSFASGYLTLQIYTPLMHLFHGPVLGGKVGISLTLVNAAFTLSNVWMYTITPKINMLISRKEWSVLDTLFRKRLLISCISYLVIIVSFFICSFFFSEIEIVGKLLGRFLSMKAIIFLLSAYFLQLFINSWAVYLRGHKKEPFWVISMISAIWVPTLTIIAGKYFTPDYFFIGMLSSYFWAIPACYLVYRYFKRIWHNDPKTFA